MMTSSTDTLKRLTWLGLLAIACSEPEAEEEIPFPVEYATEALRIATDFDAELCAGNINLMDAQFRWLQRELPGARERPIGIYLYAGQGPIAELPQVGEAAGYWDSPVVHAVWDAVSHEMVHAAMSGVTEAPLAHLQEGFAVALSGSPQLQEGDSRANMRPALQRPFFQGLYDLSAYKMAGHFARWMFAKYGAQASVQIYARSTSGMNESELSDVWMDVVGESLDEALTDYEVHGEDVYPGLGPMACGQGEPVAWDGDELSWEGVLSCFDTVSFGLYFESGAVRLLRRWRIEIPEEAVLDVQFSGAQFVIERCVTDPAKLSDLSWPQDQVVEDWSSFSPLYLPFGDYPRLKEGPLTLQAGVYDVWVNQGAGETNPTFSISFLRM